jgi:hypothetical protein
VFDGHGGVGCCNLLQRRLHLALAAHPRFALHPAAACAAVFPQLDAEVLMGPEVLGFGASYNCFRSLRNRFLYVLWLCCLTNHCTWGLVFPCLCCKWVCIRCARSCGQPMTSAAPPASSSSSTGAPTASWSPTVGVLALLILLS